MTKTFGLLFSGTECSGSRKKISDGENVHGKCLDPVLSWSGSHLAMPPPPCWNTPPYPQSPISPDWRGVSLACSMDNSVLLWWGSGRDISHPARKPPVTKLSTTTDKWQTYRRIAITDLSIRISPDATSPYVNVRRRFDQTTSPRTQPSRRLLSRHNQVWHTLH